MNEPKRMLEYQKHKKYFAQVAGTLEKVATAELTELGAEVFREVPRGLYFAADDATLYRILYQSRIIQRLLAPLISFPAHSEKYLYDQATRNIDWTALFGISETFGIESNVSDSAITHSLYAGQILKDAICDSFRKVFDKHVRAAAPTPFIGGRRTLYMFIKTVADGGKLRGQGCETFLKTGDKDRSCREN